MKSNINEDTLKEYGAIPSVWNNKIGYQYATNEHYDDGWRDLVTPEIDYTIEKLGELYFDETDDVVTYEVIEKTVEEIEAETLQEAKQKQQKSIQKLVEKKLIEELQNEDDDDKIIENKEAYPIWQPNGELILAGTKLQAFNSNNELSIFRCNQDILATEQYEPRLAVYAFDEIIMGGDYPIWQQPQAHNPYMEGDIVWYVNEGDTLYISTIDNNVHAPNIVAGAWEIYEQ